MKKKVSKLVKDNTLSHGDISRILPKEIYLSTTILELNNVLKFRKSVCKDNSNEAKLFHRDGFDNFSCVLYSKDVSGNLIATARFLLESKFGFPEESYASNHLTAMRSKGLKIAEAGRFTIIKDKTKLLRSYYKAIYDISKYQNIDIVIMVIKTKNVSSYKKMMSIDVLENNVGLSWDSERDNLSLVSWNINKYQPKFYIWTNKIKKVFSEDSWNDYSYAHLSVFTSIQKEIYESVAKKASKNVLDVGCGTARVMAYLQSNKSVTSYTGIDLSPQMITHANWLKNELDFNKAKLINSRIESLTNKFDFIFSIHSYYAWENKIDMLRNIYSRLKRSGIFIIVTPNNNFDEDKLSQVVKQEVIGHPHYKDFINANLGISNRAKSINLYNSIDSLIEVVRKVGFKVNTAHNDFFMGGASYLELIK